MTVKHRVAQSNESRRCIFGEKLRGREVYGCGCRALFSPNVTIGRRRCLSRPIRMPGGGSDSSEMPRRMQNRGRVDEIRENGPYRCCCPLRSIFCDGRDGFGVALSFDVKASAYVNDRYGPHRKSMRAAAGPDCRRGHGPFRPRPAVNDEMKKGALHPSTAATTIRPKSHANVCSAGTTFLVFRQHLTSGTTQNWRRRPRP